MAQLLAVAVTNDPRNSHNFTNLAGAIDLVIGNPADAASFAGFGPVRRGIVLDFGANVSIHSITARLNTAGSWGFSGWLLEWATAAAPTTWTTFTGTESGSPANTRTLTITGGPITARYVALSHTDSYPGAAFRPHLTIDVAYADADAAPTPPPPPPITVTINGVVFEQVLEMEARFELNGQGSFRCVLSRSDPQATEENLTRGNVVQLVIPQIHDGVLGEFLLETGDFDLIKKGEEGEEELHFGGPGTLAYLKRAVMAWEQYLGVRQECFPNKGVWIWENSAGSRTEGDIIRRMIDEAQAAARPKDPIPAVTRTFTDDDDSNGDPWGDEEFEGQWKTAIGANVYDEVIKLARAGLIYVEMAPGMELNAYRSQGRDLTGTAFGAGVVRFVKGTNITTELGKGMAGAAWADEAVIRLSGGDYEWAAISGTFPYSQETYIETDSDNLNTARRQAQGQMRLREDAQEAMILGVLRPREGQEKDVDTGLYLPGPVWSDHGDYWIGDIITLHAPNDQDEFEFDNIDQRIFAITLSMDKDTGELALPVVELNAPWTKPGQVGDLQATGGSPSSSGPGGGGGGGGAGPHVHTAYQSRAEKDQAGGYAGLDDDGHLDVDEMAETPFDHGSMGSTETIDVSDHTWHRGTLSAAVAITVTGFTADEGRIALLEFTGDEAITWDADVDFGGGDDQPNASGYTAFLLWSSEGSTDIKGAKVGSSSGSSLTVKDEGSPLATAASSMDFVGEGVVASGTTGDKTITISGAPTGAAGGDLSGTYPNPFVTDDSHSHTAATLPATATGGGDHEHVIDVFNGDASTTVFELSAEPFDPEQVFAFVGGSWTAVTISGTMNTTATFGSAPGSGTGNVVIQYPAVVA